MTRKKLDEAIAAGKKNAEAAALVQNWCRHARVARMGGIGLVEQMTSLPIGHFSMECDHALAGGIAAWDLGQAAIDFYDRNCSTCIKREPVGFPTIKKLVDARDERHRRAEAEAESRRVEAEQAKARRDCERKALRIELDPINQALLDDLQTFEETHSDAERMKVVEAARLAPDKVDERVLAYLLDRSAESNACALMALEIGAAMHRGDRGLLLLAYRLLRSGNDEQVVVDAVCANLASLKDEDLVQIVPRAAELASPSYRPYAHYRRRGDPRLFLRLWSERPEVVRRGIDILFDRCTLASSQLAGRAISTIIAADPSAASGFVRPVVSRFVRAKQIIEDLDEYGSPRDLARTIDQLLDIVPEQVDTLLQELATSAPPEVQAMVADAYALCWRSFRDDREAPPSCARLAVGLARLPFLPTTFFDQQVLNAVVGAFRHPPEELWQLVAQHADKLIGAALLLDQHASAIGANNPKDVAFITAMEQRNLRSAAYDLIEELLKAAARSATTAVARRQFLEAVSGIPETSPMARSLAIKASMKLARDVDGLSDVLPTLYGGMVGADVIGRAEAAAGIAEIGYEVRQHLPPLVFEAFCVLLLDQYVYVHKNAVRALERITLPASLRPKAAYALFQLVSAYSESSDDEAFLLDCVEGFANYASDMPDPGKAIDFCCRAALRASPEMLRYKARGLRHRLKASDDFALVVAHVLPVYVGDLNTREDEGDLILAMTPASVAKHAGALLEIGTAIGLSEPWLANMLADKMVRSGAKAQGVQLLESLQRALGQTERTKRVALSIGFPLLAHAMEDALADGDTERWSELAKEWEERRVEQERLEKEQRARDSRSSFSFPH